MSLRDQLKKVIAGETLSAAEAEAAIEAIMSGESDPVVAGGLLTALATRGETVEEVTGAARAMRRAAHPFRSTLAARAVDTCGTGGDGSGTFNISTAAAFVVAAAGVPVIKHGNRAVSSKSGSADMLKALGVAIDIVPEAMAEVLEEVGLAFLFAPVYHPAMRHAVPIRRSLGVRTLFNLLGPICNPAAVTHQVIGVFDARWLALAEVLRNLGAERAMVVHGADGLDELSLSGVTYVAELRGDALTRHQLTPEAVGLAPCDLEDLKGGDAEANAATLRRLFAPRPAPLDDPIARAVAYNAAAALYVAGEVESVADGVPVAAEQLRSGAALACVERFAEATAARIAAGIA